MAYKKGYAFERELKKHLEKEGWCVIRSGGSKKPDIVAAKDGKIIVIECKSTIKDCAYLEKDEVKKLIMVATAFGGECIYAIKQNNKGFSLIDTDQLIEKENSYFVSLK
ncbi:hypothetical protein GQ473_00670 [archaeon]|nr:hypothetical protein [archaeon]